MGGGLAEREAVFLAEWRKGEWERRLASWGGMGEGALPQFLMDERKRRGGKEVEMEEEARVEEEGEVAETMMEALCQKGDAKKLQILRKWGAWVHIFAAFCRFLPFFAIFGHLLPLFAIFDTDSVSLPQF